MNYWNFAGPGSIAGLLACAGLIRLARKERRLAGLFFAPLFVQWLLVSRYPDGTWARYLLAVFPGLALLAAEAFDWTQGARRGFWTPLLAVLALAPGFLRGAFADAQMRLPDTRPLAAEWITRNIPQGAAILLDLPHASPALSMAKEEVQELEARTRAQGSPRARLYRGMAQRHPGGGYRLYCLRRFAHELYSGPRQVELSQADYWTIDTRFGLGAVRAMKVDYVVTSSWGAQYTQAPELTGFFSELYQQTRLVKDFIPAPGQSAGPVLRIFKL